MERDRGTKVIAVIALVVAIVGLSVGFAAFTSQLTINASSSTVNPSDSAFAVKFSTTASKVEKGEVTPEVTPGEVDGFSGNQATISDDKTITNIGGTFTAPGQSIKYEFFVRNDGEYDAYLKSIIYSNVDETSNIKCEALSTTTPALVEKACKGFELKVEVGSHNTATSTVASITEQKLAKKTDEKVVVTLTYKPDAERADGDFTVKFGAITLNYSSSDAG